MNNPIIMTYKNQHLGLNGWMILKKNEACMQHSSLKTDSTVTILIHYHIRMISSKNEKVISMLVFKMHPYLLTTVCNYHTFVQFFPHSVTFSSPVSPEKDGFLLLFRFIRRWHYLQHIENSERFDTWTLWKAINKQKIVCEQNFA